MDVDLNVNVNATLDVDVDRKCSIEQARAMELLEEIVAVLTTMTSAVNVKGGVQVHVHVDVKVNVLN